MTVAGIVTATPAFLGAIRAVTACIHHGLTMHAARLLHGRLSHVTGWHGHLRSEQTLQRRQHQHQGQNQNDEFSRSTMHGGNDNDFHFHSQTWLTSR